MRFRRRLRFGRKEEEELIEGKKIGLLLEGRELVDGEVTKSGAAAILGGTKSGNKDFAAGSRSCQNLANQGLERKQFLAG